MRFGKLWIRPDSGLLESSGFSVCKIMDYMIYSFNIFLSSSDVPSSFALFRCPGRTSSARLDRVGGKDILVLFVI